MKTIRTYLYGDFSIDEMELEILHTPIMQRLYNIKQLGFTDRVYPDAVHSRFNHVLGTLERADKILKGIYTSLNKSNDIIDFKYGEKNKITRIEMIEHLKNRWFSIRLMALLHDLTHIPFGHTLEDELGLFNCKHDDPKRQIIFFNILTGQLIYGQIIRHTPVKATNGLVNIITKVTYTKSEEEELIERFIEVKDRIEDSYKETPSIHFFDLLEQLNFAIVALLHLKKIEENHTSREISHDSLLINKLMKKIDNQNKTQLDFSLGIDAFCADIIGNTICADLLDYSRRDAVLSGLKYDYDDRIFKYFTLVSIENKEQGINQIRVALQLFTNKLRHDVISEIITILRNRYLISERIIFHPTKCSAGAMLGEASHLSGLLGCDVLQFYVLDDSAFLLFLQNHIDELSKTIYEFKNRIFIEKETEKINVIEKILIKSKAYIEKEENNFHLNSEIYKNEDINKHLKEFFNIVDTFEVQKSDKFEINIIPALFYIMLEEIVMPDFVIQKSLLPISFLKKLIGLIEERILTAKRILWQLTSRQYYKRVFRIAGIDPAISAGSCKNIADLFSKPNRRFRIERKIEKQCNIPYGSVIIHCPIKKTMMKEANVIVIGSERKAPIRFKEIRESEDHELSVLKPYSDEVYSIQNMYEKIWNLYVFVNEGTLSKLPLIERICAKTLGEYSEHKPLQNNKELSKELEQNYREVAYPLYECFRYIESESSKVNPRIDYELAEYLLVQVNEAKKRNLSIPELLDGYMNTSPKESGNNNQNKINKL